MISLVGTPRKERKRTDAAERLIARRGDLGFSHRSLAAKSGVSRATIADIERGVRPHPRWDTATRLARALGTTVEDLFGDGA
jgi:DNA-binding XRE family transcriptional regulator